MTAIATETNNKNAPANTAVTMVLVSLSSIFSTMSMAKTITTISDNIARLIKISNARFAFDIIHR